MKKKNRDFAVIRQLLLDEYHSALNLIQGQEAEFTENHSDATDDISGEAQQNEQMEVITQLATKSSQRFKKIVEALDKINDKSYGSCEECEQDIPLARLEVLPFATHCLKCQIALENN